MAHDGSRFTSGLLGVVFIAIGAYNLAAVPEFGLTPAVLGVAAMFAAWLFITRALGKPDPLPSFPESLRQLAKIYFAILGFVVVVSAVGMFITSPTLGISDIWWVIFLAVMSWFVWGIAIFVIAVLPLWFAWHLIHRYRGRNA